MLTTIELPQSLIAVPQDFYMSKCYGADLIYRVQQRHFLLTPNPRCGVLSHTMSRFLSAWRL